MKSLIKSLYATKKLKKINEKNKNTSIATKKKDNNQKKKAK